VNCPRTHLVLAGGQKADLVACKAAIQGKTTFMGPIDPSGVLAQGTPELVRQKCQEALEIMAPGGGFILSSGCAMPSTNPDENIQPSL
jgi:uroporphyrinogen-III decarboxylase